MLLVHTITCTPTATCIIPPPLHTQLLHTQLVDLLSSLSLSKAALAADAGAAAGRLCGGAGAPTEFTLAALLFLATLLRARAAAAVPLLLDLYPSVIFKQLLARAVPEVVAATCRFLADFAAGGAEAQRYCRIEEVLPRVVDALAAAAEQLRAAGRDAEAAQVRVLLSPDFTTGNSVCVCLWEAARCLRHAICAPRHCGHRPPVCALRLYERYIRE